MIGSVSFVPGAGGAGTGGLGVFLAHFGAVLGMTVPVAAQRMVDHASGVEPDAGAGGG